MGDLSLSSVSYLGVKMEIQSESVYELAKTATNLLKQTGWDRIPEKEYTRRDVGRE